MFKGHSRIHPVCECGTTVLARLSERCGIWYIPPDFELDEHVVKKIVQFEFLFYWKPRDASHSHFLLKRK